MPDPLSQQEFDVVIVGAGVSGALIAWELVQAGHSVLMLEAGPDKTTQADRNLLVENYYKASSKTPESPYPKIKAVPKPTTDDTFTLPYDGYFDQAWSSLYEKGQLFDPEANRLENYPNLNASYPGVDSLAQEQLQALNEAATTVRDNWFKSTYERRVGGTTWHWLGTCLRLVPGDFTMRSRFSGPAYIERLKAAGDQQAVQLAEENPLPDGFIDWPFDYPSMKPWYTRAEKEMGVSGDPNGNLGGADRIGPNGNQEPFPMPEVPMSIVDKTVGAAADGKLPADPETNETLPGFRGFTMKVESTPQGRNSVGGYQDRPQCCGNSSCIPICPVHAKYDATVHVNLCRNHYGKFFTLSAKTIATEVLLEPTQDGEATPEKPNIAGVKCQRWTGSDDDPVRDGDPFVVRGRYYIVAAHAVESPRLLLNSKNGPGIWGQRGVANSSGALGCYLMDHNTSLSFALAPQPVFPIRGPVSTSGIESLKDNNARGFAGTFRVEIGNLGWEWPDNSPYTQIYNHARNNEYGEEIQQALKQELSRQFRFGCLVEPTPMKSHCVSLSETRRDWLGIPVPKIEYGIMDDPYSVRGYVNSLKVNQFIFQQMKATGIGHLPPPQFAGAGHIMGTCRMGLDPSATVVDQDQVSHDHRNLLITGSSVFPTVGASNPTLTIGALSLKAAAHLKSLLAARA